MNKKKIKGGIRLQSKDIEIKQDHKINDDKEVTYKKGEIETEEKITNGKKKFKLYKITGISKPYTDEKFILPDGIKKDDLKHIYLFGYSGEYSQQLFVRKNASDTIDDLLDHIGKNLNLLFATPLPLQQRRPSRRRRGNVRKPLHLFERQFQKASLNIILIYSEEDKCLFIIFDMNNSEYEHYEKFEGLFSPASFVSDKKLKKQINISDLKLLIDYTYKKISYATLHQKLLDRIKTNLNDKRLKKVDTGDKKNIQDEIKKLQNEIYEFEEEILKDSKNDIKNYNELQKSMNQLKEDFNKFLTSLKNTRNRVNLNDLEIRGGYKKKLKRKELNTLSLAELKQLHRSNGIKMNNNRNKIGLINNYIKNNVNN